ncbi:glucose-6-phosphate dehydrogenase [Actinoplanes couchii]|uniref:Glucose-6-phosphate 1-dehydrogenase n=1 Tax=Actinoplanes couchii TaxID=403638 RepID=A0ABQ3X1K2_9ACTN|nr:glucose-6-phosphate dehydrogenase [Actinoplanes couchii]MDR6316681.1 glucose-6-phosphate 1-dehydrogenase [Actinoplanes couchii]GID52290.1 glucose-6-phosphate 1-dehydrogenase [Actinoplanes couchii]
MDHAPQLIQERSAPPATLVIFGASGDLTRRKLLPAVDNLARHGRLPDQFALVGVARTPMSDEQFAESALGGKSLLDKRQLAGGVRYVAGGYDDPETYKRLAETLDELDAVRGTSGNRLFYLSTPAGAFEPVINGLAGAGLNQATETSFARLVIEKPYGRDLATARELDGVVHGAFEEHQVFRIDHYLGKDTVQNVLALRFANSIFQPIWDRSWIDHVQITVAETLGVGTRGGFYEGAGAMRDIVQNHVLQVLALALMEPPVSFEGENLRNEKVKLLQAIRLPTDRDVSEAAVRGQYTRGGTREELMAGYREEVGVDPLSRTETYAAMRLNVDNWRWAGVPFYVRTGKRLPARLTEVALQFQRPPHLPIPADQLTELDADALILRIQPNEGISLRFGAKVPGHSFRVRTASMNFSYDQTFVEESPEAYERLLLDALIGDASLFIRSDEVQQSWRIVDPIIEHWERDRSPIPSYEAASWGPTDADRLIGRNGRKWRNAS